MKDDLRAAYQSMQYIIVEDIARLVTKTTDRVERAGIALVVNHILQMRSKHQPVKRERTEA